MRGQTRAALAHRLRIVRVECFGEHGVSELAGKLDIPARTWLNYEAGVRMSGDTILAFVEVTAVEPLWLLRGSGPRYRAAESRLNAAEARPGRIGPQEEPDTRPHGPGVADLPWG